ncbi:hypothetical protein RY27_13300 [Litorilinea aerophila]|nr:hypothetical protein RY27_13300 [Litorilinea aerophila]
MRRRTWPWSTGCPASSPSCRRRWKGPTWTATASALAASCPRPRRPRSAPSSAPRPRRRATSPWLAFGAAWW